MIEPGSPAPQFTLPDHRGEPFALRELRGRRVVLCFYPGDFSPVCSDQLSIYGEVIDRIRAEHAELIGISTDSTWTHGAFRDQLGIEIALLSDFHPKGEVARAYGAYVEARGHPTRSLVLVDEDGIVRWAHESPDPLEVPGPNLIFDALAALR